MSFALDPDVLHLNHGSFGAVPSVVTAEQQRIRDRVESNPDAFFSRDLGEFLPLARDLASSFLGLDDVVFVRNATMGVSAAMQSFAQLGTRILLTDHTYEGILNSAHRVARECGGEVVVANIAVGANDDEIVDSIVGRIQDDNSVVVIDQITSPTAIEFPVKRIAALAAERGAKVVVDGAHVPGHRTPEVADAWAGNFHKWTYAPRPSAALWVAPQYRADVHPPISSDLFGGEWPFRFDWLGTDDFSSYLATPAAIAFHTQADHTHCEQIAAEGAELVADAVGGRAIPGTTRMRLVELPIKLESKLAAQQLQRTLADELRTEVAVTRHGDSAYLRLSAATYNSGKEFQVFAQRITGFF